MPDMKPPSLAWSCLRKRYSFRMRIRSVGAPPAIAFLRGLLNCRQSRSAIRERLPDEQRGAILLFARLALKIDEQMLEPDHPKVAIRLNNLAGLLRATNTAGSQDHNFAVPCSSQDCIITSFPDQFMGWSRGGHSAENRLGFGMKRPSRSPGFALSAAAQVAKPVGQKRQIMSALGGLCAEATPRAA